MRRPRTALVLMHACACTAAKFSISELVKLRIRYESALATQPVLTKGATGFALALVGDATAQAIQSRAERDASVDLRRSYAFSVHQMLWTAVGLHPIITFFNRIAPGSSLRAIATKTVLQVGFMDPFLYLPSVYLGNGLLRGDTLGARAQYPLGAGKVDH